MNDKQEKIVFDFETQFGNCFQPFGELLDKAKKYLRTSLKEISQETKEELLDTLSHSPKKEREGIQVVDWEDILIFIHHYRKKGGNSSQD